MAEPMTKDFLAVLDRVCSEHGWTRDRYTLEVPVESGGRQTVLLDAFDFEDEELVRVASPIGPMELTDPLHMNTALRLNYGLPHGSLAMSEDRLVLVDTLLADEPDAEEIEAVIEYLAETAEYFERSIFGGDEI